MQLIDEYESSFNYRVPCITKDLRRLVLPIDNHVYKLNSDRNIYIQNTGRHLVLRLPNISGKDIFKLWNQYQAKFNPKALSFSIKTFISNIGEVQKLIQYLYRKQIDDDWFIALITDKRISIVNTVKHYASISEQQLQGRVNQHLGLFLEGVEFYKSTSPIRVGSLYYPNEQVLKKQFSATRRLINLGVKKLETSVLPTNIMIPWLNLLAFYTDCMIAYSVGTRNVEDPFVQPEKVLSTGWTIIDDKNQFSGYNSREVFLPKTVIEQIEAYRELKSIVFNKLTDRGVTPGLNHVIDKNDKTSSKFEEFKLNDKLKGFLNQNDLLILEPIAHPLGKPHQNGILPKSYTRQYMHNLLKDFFKYSRTMPKFNTRNLKTNTNRHYLRGKLLELNVNPMYINSLLGHWHIGQEPWSYRLLFNQEQYHQQIERAIPLLLKDIGLDKPIKFKGLSHKRQKDKE